MFGLKVLLQNIKSGTQVFIPVFSESSPNLLCIYLQLFGRTPARSCSESLKKLNETRPKIGVFWGVFLFYLFTAAVWLSTMPAKNGNQLLGSKQTARVWQYKILTLTT